LSGYQRQQYRILVVLVSVICQLTLKSRPSGFSVNIAEEMLIQNNRRI